MTDQEWPHMNKLEAATPDRVFWSLQLLLIPADQTFNRLPEGVYTAVRNAMPRDTDAALLAMSSRALATRVLQRCEQNHYDNKTIMTTKPL